MSRQPTTGGFVVVATDPKKRNCFVVVPNLKRALKPPHPVCPTCNMSHMVKTYHIWVNGEGRAVVSPTVFKGLQQAHFGHQLVPEGHTDKPPKLILGTRKGRGGKLETGLILSREQMVAHY